MNYRSTCSTSIPDRPSEEKIQCPRCGCFFEKTRHAEWCPDCMKLDLDDNLLPPKRRDGPGTRG